MAEHGPTLCEHLDGGANCPPRTRPTAKNSEERQVCQHQHPPRDDGKELPVHFQLYEPLLVRWNVSYFNLQRRLWRQGTQLRTTHHPPSASRATVREVARGCTSNSSGQAGMTREWSDWSAVTMRGIIVGVRTSRNSVAIRCTTANHGLDCEHLVRLSCFRFLYLLDCIYVVVYHQIAFPSMLSSDVHCINKK